MLGRLNQLDCGVVTRADGDIGRQRHLWQTHSPGVRIVGRADDEEGRDDGVAHIFRDFAEAEIDVDQGSGMAWEPARLEGDSTAADGPLSSVGRPGHTTALKNESVIDI